MRICLLLCFLNMGAFAAEPVKWYKGNTHTHTLWSDGNDFPEMIVDWYVKRGYDFLALSDHNVLAEGEKWVDEAVIEKKKIALGRPVMDKYRERFGKDWVITRLNAEGKPEVRLKTLEEFRPLFEQKSPFLLMQAEEISASLGKIPVHLNALNVVEAIQPKKDLGTLKEVIRANLRAVAEQAAKTGKPMIVHINHPNFRWALTAEDLAHAIEDRFFEVFNGHPKTFPEGDAQRAETSTDRMWDIANTIRLVELKQPPLYGLATDDSHHYHGGDSTPGRGWIMVKSPKLESDALIEAMKRGDFYASTGVVLEDITFDPSSKQLAVSIKAEPGVNYVTEFRGTRKGYDRAIAEVKSPLDDPHPVRLRYSEEVGQVLAKVNGTSATYRFQGDELYVRAIVYADKAVENPVAEGDKQRAWTQPVGWR